MTRIIGRPPANDKRPAFRPIVVLERRDGTLSITGEWFEAGQKRRVTVETERHVVLRWPCILREMLRQVEGFEARIVPADTRRYIARMQALLRPAPEEGGRA